ncbi:unnamed protein product [Camellia sinensis]
MSQSRMLAHNNNNNVGSERNSNGSDDDDSTPLSTLTKGDMKVMMNRMMKRMLQSEIKTMVRNNRATHATDGQVAGATHAVVKLLRHLASAPLFTILLVSLPSEVAEGKRKPKKKQLSCGGSTCDGQIAEALYLNAAISSIVEEESESVQERILTSMNQKRKETRKKSKRKGWVRGQEFKPQENSGNKIHCSEPRRMQLRFLDKLPSLLVTGRHIKGENCSSVRIGLFDDKVQVVTSGAEASAKVEILVLPRDPGKDEEDEWTQEEFNSKIVKAILTRNAFLNLKEGIGSLDEISFVHRSSWMKKSEYRLEARIVDNFNGTKVREAKSEHFFLKDFRNKRDEKHYPPSLTDKVWRLENIGRSGPIVKRLSKENIVTVQDFLKKCVMDRQGLRDILGNGITDMKLEVTLQHALTCRQLDKRFIYPPPSSQQETRVVFNAVGQVVAKVSGCHCIPIDNLSETEKADAQKLVVSAFEHRGQIVPYDDNSPQIQPGWRVLVVLMLGIVSSNNSIGTSQMIGIGDMEFTYGTLELRCEHSQATCQVPNDQMLDFVSMCQDIGKHFNQHLEESQAVTIDKKPKEENG